MKGVRIIKIAKFEGDWGSKRQELFPETIIYEVFETNSSFDVK